LVLLGLWLWVLLVVVWGVLGVVVVVVVVVLGGVVVVVVLVLVLVVVVVMVVVVVGGGEVAEGRIIMALLHRCHHLVG
jgi:hypothetical protein